MHNTKESRPRPWDIFVQSTYYKKGNSEWNTVEGKMIGKTWVVFKNISEGKKAIANCLHYTKQKSMVKVLRKIDLTLWAD